MFLRLAMVGVFSTLSTLSRGLGWNSKRRVRGAEPQALLLCLLGLLVNSWATALDGAVPGGKTHEEHHHLSHTLCDF